MNKFVAFSIIYMAFIGVSFAQLPLEHIYVWYSADSVYKTSNRIDTLYDLSGHSLHLSQTVLNNKPYFLDNDLNDHPVINFQGNQWMKCEFPQILDQPITVFVIWKNSAATHNRVCFSNYGLLDYYFSLRYFVGVRISASVDLTYDKIAPYGYILNSSIYNGTTSRNYENGILKAAGNAGSKSVDGITLGALYDNSLSLNGNIAELLLFDTVLNDTDRIAFEQYLFDKYSPPLLIQSDLNIEYSLCDTALFIDQSFTNILWSTGATNDSIFVNQTGQYWVQAKDIFGRMRYDTINVQFPNPNLQNTSICLGDSVLYEPDLIGTYNYLWSDAGTETSKYLKDAGDYWLRIEDSFGCFDTVFFTVSVDSFKNKISLGNDTSLCSGNTISLIEGEELCSSFLWTANGNTNPTQIVTESGWQKIEVENSNGCQASDSIYVTIVGAAPIPGYIVENLCFGETTQFIDNSTPQADIASWKWIINENDTLYTQNAEWVFASTGSQDVILIVESISGCVNYLSFEIEIVEIPLVNVTHYPVCIGTMVDFESEIQIPDGSVITSYNWYLNGTEVSSEPYYSTIFYETTSQNLLLTVGIDNGCLGSYEEIITVAASFQLPEYTSLVLPNNNTIITPATVDFYWNSSDYAIEYELLLSRNMDFTELVDIVENVTTNHTEYDLINVSDSVIYWKVKSYNACYDFTESNINSFVLFDPDNYGHMSLWFNADSVQITDDYIERIYDLSNYNFNITQSNIANRPELLSDALNGKPAISFDGTNDFFEVIFNQDFMQPNTYFVVWNIDFANTFPQLPYSGITANKTNATFWSSLNGGSIVLNGGTYVPNLYLKPAPFDFMLTTTIFNGSSTQIFENSILQNTVSGGTNPVDGLYIGGIYNNSYWLNGSIAEFMFFDSLNNLSCQQQVERYLHDKYFPPVNLGYDIRIPYGFCDTAITTAYKPWFTSYEWSTGETDSIIYVNKPGVYSVTVTDIFGFESSDDIRVFYPEVNDFADTIVCFGNSVVWDAALVGDYSFAWYGSSETTQQINIDSQGDYAIIVSDTLGCQYLSDTINFSFDNYEFTSSVGPADTTLCAGNRLMLVTNAVQTVTWEWSTGSSNSEIVLSTTGEYSVTTTNWRGCQAVDTINVTINGTVPVPNFESLGHCSQNPVYFTDLSTSPEGTINSWTWSINGEIFSTEQNPILSPGDIPNATARFHRVVPPETSGVEGHRVVPKESSGNIPSQTQSNQTKSPINYQVQLTVETDAGCSDFITNNLTIYPLPTVSFTPQLVCQNTAVEFTSTSSVAGGTIINDIWEFLPPTGQPINRSTDQPINRPTDQPINWSTAQPINRPTAQPINRSTDQPINRSTGQPINRSNAQPINRSTGQLVNWSTAQPINRSTTYHTFVNPGYHTVQLTSTSDAGCVDSAEFEVYVKPAELPQFLAENTCLGEPVYFINQTPYNPVSLISEINWDFGDGESSDISSPQHIFEDAGLHDIGLTINYSNGCILGTTQEIEVYHKPEVDIISLSACEGSAFGLVPQASVESGNIATYNWQLGDPVFFESDQESPDLGISDAGNYPISLEVSSDLGCSTLVSDTLRVHVAPESDFTASRTWGAVPLWVDFTNTSLGAEAYTWSINNEQFSSDENPYFVFQDSGLFVVELTSYNEFGCHDISTLTIKSVIPVMDIILYSLRTVVEGDYLKTSVYIINNGTLPVDQLNLDLNLGSGKIYRETIENFEPSQVLDYTFTFKPYLANGELPELVCVEAVDPTYGIYTDINYENNTVCNTNVQNLLVFRPYPNPASNHIICEFITAKTEDLTITLINGIGKIVHQQSYPNHTGYQKTIIDVSTFSQGVYYLQISTSTEKQSFKIEVNR